MGTNHIAAMYVKFNDVSLNEVDSEVYGAVKDSLVKCPNDTVKAERALMMKLLGTAFSFDRYQNDKTDPYIIDLALLSSSPEPIIHDFPECHLKIAASYGELTQLVRGKNIAPQSIEEMHLDPKSRGFFVELWNNNLDGISEKLLTAYINRVAARIEEECPNNAKIVYQWSK